MLGVDFVLSDKIALFFRPADLLLMGYRTLVLASAIMSLLMSLPHPKNLKAAISFSTKIVLATGQLK
jgi:hypothetical protein